MHQALPPLFRLRSLGANDLPRDCSLNSVGVDSLMAVELSTRVEHEMGVTLPTHLLMKSPAPSARVLQTFCGI